MDYKGVRQMPIVKVSFNEIKPKFTRPGLLQHPNIPKFLSGINPRTIMGQEWWDKLRREVYELNNYHCFACGIHPSEARYQQWLEAHECYNYRWKEQVLHYKGTVALCYPCHHFIHCGRLSNLVLDRRVELEELNYILLHGLRILHKAGLKPDQKARKVARQFQGEPWEYVVAHKIKASTSSVVHVVDLLQPGWLLSFEDRLYDYTGMEVKKDGK